MFLTGLFAAPQFAAQIHPTSPLGGGFYNVGMRVGAQLLGIVIVFAWSFAQGFLLFGAMWLFDRNRYAMCWAPHTCAMAHHLSSSSPNRETWFYVRGTSAHGLKTGGNEMKKDVERFAAPALTGFIDPLAHEDDVEVEAPFETGSIQMEPSSVSDEDAGLARPNLESIEL